MSQIVSTAPLVKPCKVSPFYPNVSWSPWGNPQDCMWSGPCHLLIQSLTLCNIFLAPWTCCCARSMSDSLLPQGLCTAVWDTLPLDGHGSLSHLLEVFAQNFLFSETHLDSCTYIAAAHLTPGLLSQFSWFYLFCSMEMFLKYCTIYVYYAFYLLFAFPLEYKRTEFFFSSFAHWWHMVGCSRFLGSLKEHFACVFPEYVWISCFVF